MRNAAFILALIAGLGLGPALAHQCPGMMADIDAAMADAELSEAEQEQVAQLRAEGEELHEAGDHDASVETLNEAKAILGID